MLKWFKKKSADQDDKKVAPVPDQAVLPGDQTTLKAAQAVSELSQEADGKSDKMPTASPKQLGKSGVWRGLRLGLQKTRHKLTAGLSKLFLGKKKVDSKLLAQIKEQLLLSDMGVSVTQSLIAQMTDRVERNLLADTDALLSALKESLLEILAPCQRSITLDKKPYVILVVGVNGTGKTTTIGKLTKHFQNQGKKVLLAAGDTFRAAAVQQLKVWGARNHTAVIAQKSGADSASVIFDAFCAARAREVDILIADTAGRLHTQSHLMDELAKITRVLKKLDPDAPHETMLILDAGIGQNTLTQAKQFHQCVKLDSVCLTKLDGTAKGGSIFALAKALKLPIRFVGVGEGIDDLAPFDARAFVETLLDIRAGSE